MAYTTINKSTDHFNTNLYTGNNTETSHTIGFQPDWTWLKVRNASGDNYLFDSIRGTNNYIRSNRTEAQGTLSGTLTSFDSNGYTVGTSNAVNTNNETMVGWNWKAGTAFTNDASSTGIGTIDSSGSVNTSAGFSICSWVGTGSNGTIKHGLSTVPEMMIIKNTGHDTNWSVYTKPTGELGELRLNSTDAFVDDATLYNDTAPTSSVFSVGTNYNTNHSDGRTYIGYIFSSVQGYSKFGSYVGTGNANGAFIYTGFRPAFVMVKRTDSTNNWIIYDNKRPNSFNEITHVLLANSSDAEHTSTSDDDCDFLSNGVKMRCTNNASNGGGASYIFMAFAEAPLVGTNNVPCNAR